LSGKIVTLYYTLHRWVFTECNGQYIQNKISSVEYIVYDMGKVKLCTGNFNNFAMHYIPYH